MRKRSGLGGWVLLWTVIPAAAQALTFTFTGQFDVGGFGDPGGVPRGLTIFGGDLVVSDAGDDQLYETDTAGALQNAHPTTPFDCPGLPCVPPQNADTIWDVAYDGTNLWVVDRDLAGGSSTWLIQLNSAGEFLNRFDVSTGSPFSTTPGGLEYDPRGAGSLLLSDALDDRAYRFDLLGNYLGQSYSLAASGNPRGIAHFAGDTFLVSDLTDDEVYEFSIPSGAGAPAFLGVTNFLGIDINTAGELTSVDYDAGSQTLYLLDNQNDRVLVFALIPEPGTGALLSLGLVALAWGRARRR